MGIVQSVIAQFGYRLLEAKTEDRKFFVLAVIAVMPQETVLR